MNNLRPIAERVKQQAGFRSVLVGLVRDDASKPVRAEAVDHVRELIRMQRELTGRDVVVVPVLVASGRVSRETIPADLKGLPVIYSGETLLPHPGMARWIETRVHDMARRDVAGTAN
jgi:sirohydrochlorin ferrochelatase